MAVVAAFSAVPQVGLIGPSETVVFTDNSTGGPDNWLWNFGDGSFSSEQHPQHTFFGSAGDTFSVTLKAWINSSVIPMTMSLVGDKIEKRIGFGDDPGDAFDGYLAQSWAPLQPSGGPRFHLRKIHATSFTYEGGRETRRASIPATPSGGGASVFLIEFTLSSEFVIDEGSISSDAGGNISASATKGVYHAFVDVTGFMGSSLDILYSAAESVLSDPGIGNKSGISGGPRLREYTTASSADHDQTTKLIVFGLPPIAAFTARPTSGPNPLSVQFENLSTPAIGLPTTYLWKKRKTGSGDAFVEFSTQEHPTEIFTK